MLCRCFVGKRARMIMVLGRRRLGAEALRLGFRQGVSPIVGVCVSHCVSHFVVVFPPLPLLLVGLYARPISHHKHHLIPFVGME